MGSTRTNCQREQLQARIAEYRGLCEWLFVRPFLEEAMLARDPEERARNVQLANLSRLYHEAVPWLMDSTAPSIKAGSAALVTKDMWNYANSLSDRIAKLARQNPARRRRR